MARPCGIYRTTRSIGEDVPAKALVYYHNHGDPGPGVYPPARWANNRAIFADQGVTVPDENYADTLESLVSEGFYRVTRPFFCCAEKCQRFEQDLMVQLGYNGDAQAILFVPHLVGGAVALPAEGTFVEEQQLAALHPLKIPVTDDERPRDHREQ